MNRTELVEVLELTGRALAAGNLVPMYQNFCFRKGKVSAFDDCLGIAAKCSVKDAFAVRGQTLLGLLTATRAEEVEFEFDREDVVLKAGKHRSKLPYMSEDEFLFNEPKIKWNLAMELDQEILTGLEVCLLTASRDSTMPALMGVTIQGGKQTTFYSCDSDALSRFTIKAKNADVSYTVPNSFCETVLKVVAKNKSVEGHIHVNDEWAVASLGDYSVYGRIIVNPTPLDYPKLIQDTLKGKETVFIPLPKGFNDALSRARVVADPESKKTTLSIKGANLDMLTETHLGVVRDTLPIKGKHPAVEAHVSASMVQRAIGVCDEMAVLENCSVYRNGGSLMQLLSNMGQD